MTPRRPQSPNKTLHQEDITPQAKQNNKKIPHPKQIEIPHYQSKTRQRKDNTSEEEKRLHEDPTVQEKQDSQKSPHLKQINTARRPDSPNKSKQPEDNKVQTK
ncbi:hypothetical protein ACJMK2_007478 [Sinanodonta woodiana]|uniref:Uncharacterized protein n=1 Tax=Sinanodonta woodiana TaxID=1069815 RepID=A0ABD3VIN1_SINWO